MEFKDKLKTLRKEKGISQQTLADAIFISRSAVAKWENGLGLPNETSLNALAAYFRVNKDFFNIDEPENVINPKKSRAHLLKTSITICVFALLTAFCILIMVDVFSSSYGLTSKMAANSFADYSCIHTGDYDIYYTTDWEGEASEHIWLFRPVKKLLIGYKVFEEDYEYKYLYDENYDGNPNHIVGLIYSIRGKNGYYNIIRKTLPKFPTYLLTFDTVTINGNVYPVTLNSYFVSDEPITELMIGDTILTVGD